MSKEYRYPEFNKWRWREFYKNRDVDLDKFLDKHSKDNRIFHVGTDSQVHGPKTTFCTALVAHNKNIGGSVIISKDKVKSYPSLQQKLVMESMRTLEVAWYLAQKLPNEIKIRLHADVNDDVKWESGRYKEQLVGMIMGQGYVSYKKVKPNESYDDYPRLVFWKPDSWAAMKVADRET